PTVVEIGGHTAGTDVVVVHAQTADALEEGQYQLALPPAVDHHRHGPQVHPVGGKEEQMGADPVELEHEHANPDRSLRYLDTKQLLRGHGEDALVVQRRQVVHARD